MGRKSGACASLFSSEMEEWRIEIWKNRRWILGIMDERKVSGSPLGVPPIASHHERLIGEVEGSDGQLGAILRSDFVWLAWERHRPLFLIIGPYTKRKSKSLSTKAWLCVSRPTKRTLKGCVTRTTRASLSRLGNYSKSRVMLWSWR